MTQARHWLTKTHKCFAPACRREVPIRQLMCPSHWRRLPFMLRQNLWKHYRYGQEIDGSPTKEYIVAVRAAADYYLRAEPRLFDPDGGPSDPEPAD